MKGTVILETSPVKVKLVQVEETLDEWLLKCKEQKERRKQRLASKKQGVRK